MRHTKEALLNNSKYVPTNFIEIGSMDGKDSVEAMNLFSMKRENVYVIEASPTRCVEITQTYPFLNVTRCAIWNYDGFVEFNEVKHDSNRANKGMGSIRDRDDGTYENLACEKVTIPCMQASSWLESLGNDLSLDIHLLKIDTEGCDLDVLMSFGQYLKNIRCVQLEGQKRVIWKGQRTQHEIDEFLSSMGYKEIWRREWTNAFDTLWLRNDMFKGDS